MSKETTMPQADFLETKEYRRFAEFCDACRRYCYIGLCYGPPGVGKTLSARHYAQWDLFETHLPLLWMEKAPPPELIALRTAFYTPSVNNTPGRIEKEVAQLRHHVLVLTEAALQLQQGNDEWMLPHPPPNRVELLIVDEADRLKTVSLEQLRDIYDRNGMGLVLIGMPGLEKRLSRYPQLYSRVGFVHEFRPLSSEETHVVLQRQWTQWGLTLHADSMAEMEAIAAILRITNGNFRLLHRLLAQIERLVQINALRMITKEVVELARQQLVIGSA
jgi:DNA transposition AAA+ family ATPase